MRFEIVHAIFAVLLLAHRKVERQLFLQVGVEPATKDQRS
jgi:hypothetical protein